MVIKRLTLLVGPAHGLGTLLQVFACNFAGVVHVEKLEDLCVDIFGAELTDIAATLTLIIITLVQHVSRFERSFSWLLLMILFILLFLGVQVLLDRFRHTGILLERLLSRTLFGFRLLGLVNRLSIHRLRLISDRLLILYNGCRSLTLSYRFGRLVHRLTLILHRASRDGLRRLRCDLSTAFVTFGVFLIVVVLVILVPSG